MTLKLLAVALMIGSSLWYLGLLVSLVTACVYGSAIWHGVSAAFFGLKRWNAKQNECAPAAQKKLQNIDTGTMAKMGKTSAVLAFGFIMFVAGYVWRGHEIRATYHREYAAWQAYNQEHRKAMAAWTKLAESQHLEIK